MAARDLIPGMPTPVAQQLFEAARRGVNSGAALSRDPGSGQSAGPPGYGAEPQLIHQPGGDLLMKFAHPVPDTVEVQFRTLPQAGWYAPTVSPTSPVTFETGVFEVPKGMQLWVFDYEFVPFRQSGLDPNDAVMVEDGRFSTMLGFDLTVNGRRSARLFFQLDPVPAGTQRNAFSGSPFIGAPGGTAAVFQPYAPNSPAGTSLLPCRVVRYGAPGLPFTIIAREGERVVVSATIFRPVNAALKFIQSRLMGFILGQNAAEALLQRVRPR